MTKSQIVEKLNLAGVEFDSSLTGKALVAQFPEVFQDELDASTEEEDVTVSVKSSPTNSVHFKIRNITAKGGYSVRTFSRETHGENFKEQADEFEKANTHIKVQNSDSKTNAEEVKKVSDFNRQIPQCILDRKDE